MFPVHVFSWLIRGALVLTATGGVILIGLFIRDAMHRRIW